MLKINCVRVKIIKHEPDIRGNKKKLLAPRKLQVWLDVKIKENLVLMY